jgi:hypothetical protein
MFNLRSSENDLPSPQLETFRKTATDAAKSTRLAFISSGGWPAADGASSVSIGGQPR